jgi:hypothetical protein
MACVLWMSGCADTGHVPPPAAPPIPATSAAPASDAGTPPTAPSAPASASTAVPAPAPAAAPAVAVPAVRPKPAAPAAATATGQSAVKPKAPASSNVARPKPEVAVAAAPAAEPAVTAPASVAAVAGPSASVRSVAPTLDLTALKQRLRDTNAIGVFTKLALKNQVDDLLDKFRGFYRGQVKITLPELRQSYELLVQKVLALIQDSDPPLAKEILASREAIWGLLADPQKFATL